MDRGGESPLEQLGASSGRGFPNLLSARERTASGLEARRSRLAELAHDGDTSAVLMGSWGRAEVTAGSDDDFMVLVDGAERDEVEPSIEAVKTVLDQAPGDQGVFGEPVFRDNLVGNVGLDRDDNKNLTRRMLFILESVPATAGDVYAAARERVLRRYLDESIKDFRPPRFLLNDTVRYWRTICVDFAGKEPAGPESTRPKSPTSAACATGTPPRRTRRARARHRDAHLQAVKAASSAAGRRSRTLRFSSSSPAPTHNSRKERPKSPAHT